MGLLADIYSGGNTLKRRLNALIADPAGTINTGVIRAREDNNKLLNLFANAYPMAGDRTVLNSPQQIAQFQREAADKAGEMGLAGTVGSYRGQHTAPMKGEGAAPLHDLAQIYPDDIYSSKAAQYYGHFGDARDNEAVWLMQQAKSKPNMPVTMYRAVPKEPTTLDQIKQLEKEMAAFMKRGTVPDTTRLKGSDWYNDAYAKLSALKSAPAQEVAAKPIINNGDWVTLSRQYAKEHGESALNGKYRIISKKVPARKLFTDGNSIQEFGYDESGKISNQLLNILAGAGIVGAGGYSALKDK